MREESVGSNQTDDQKLVEEAKAGDRRAFRELYERYQRRVYSIAYGYLRNQEDALDVLQEAFVKVHRNIDRFEGQSSFYTWLYRIVANLSIDHLRKKKRRRDVPFEERRDNDATVATLPMARFGDPRRAAHSHEIMQAIEAAMSELSDNHRAVLVMREVQGLSYTEMAQAMNCSKGTIMSRLFHARKNIQAVLAQQFGPSAELLGENDPTRVPAQPEVTP